MPKLNKISMDKPDSLLEALIVGVEDASKVPPLQGARLSQAEIILVAQEIMSAVVAFLVSQEDKKP